MRLEDLIDAVGGHRFRAAVNPYFPGWAEVGLDVKPRPNDVMVIVSEHPNSNLNHHNHPDRGLIVSDIVANWGIPHAYNRTIRETCKGDPNIACWSLYRKLNRKIVLPPKDHLRTQLPLP